MKGGLWWGGGLYECVRTSSRPGDTDDVMPLTVDAGGNHELHQSVGERRVAVALFRRSAAVMTTAVQATEIAIANWLSSRVNRFAQPTANTTMAAT